MPSSEASSARKRIFRWLPLGLVSIFGFALGLVVVAVVGVVIILVRLEWPNSRPLEVQVDTTLGVDGAWRVGRTSLSEPPNPEAWVEVRGSRPDGDGLVVLVERRHGDFCFDTELRLSPGDGVPRIAIQGGSHWRASSELQWPDKAVGGLVRLSSNDLALDGRSGEESIVIQYDLTATCSGSPVRRDGKVVLNVDDFR